MITWIRHAGNYEMQPPSKTFPIAIWISSRQDEVTGLTYGLSVYAGNKLILHGVSYSFEEAEQGAIEWLEKLEKDLAGLLFHRAIEDFEGNRP